MDIGSQARHGHEASWMRLMARQALSSDFACAKPNGSNNAFASSTRLIPSTNRGAQRRRYNPELCSTTASPANSKGIECLNRISATRSTLIF